MSESSRLPLRVVKVGGSLLEWPEMRPRLLAWLAEQRPAQNVLIAGGGRLADAVRDLQAIHKFDDDTAHYLCADVLTATARLLTRLVPRARLKGYLSELRDHVSDQPLALEAGVGWSPAPVVFDAGHYLRDFNFLPVGEELPHDWTVTSDSIAAHVATLLSARELVLLKSADPPPYSSLSNLAATGYVDSYFPTAAKGWNKVRFVNLRT